MQFPKQLKVEKCIAKGDVRHALNHAYLDTDKSRLIASDGHKAVVVPVTLDDGDTSGPVSADAITAARKEAGRGSDTLALECNGALSVPSGASFPRPEYIKFPDIDRAMPTGASFRLALDAQYLLDIAHAINNGRNTQVTLHIDPKGRVCSAVRVEPTRQGSDAGAFGALAPILLKDQS